MLIKIRAIILRIEKEAVWRQKNNNIEFEIFAYLMQKQIVLTQNVVAQKVDAGNVVAQTVICQNCGCGKCSCV